MRSAATGVERLERRRLLSASFDVEFGVTGPGYTAFPLPGAFVLDRPEVLDPDDLDVERRVYLMNLEGLGRTPDGRIITTTLGSDLGGRSRQDNTGPRFARARYSDVVRTLAEPDGRPVDSFGEAGTFRLDGPQYVPPFHDRPQPDVDVALFQRETRGRLIPVGDGTFLAGDPEVSGGLGDLEIVRRIRSDGSVDPDYTLDLGRDLAGAGLGVNPRLLDVAVLADGTGVAAFAGSVTPSTEGLEAGDGAGSSHDSWLVLFDPQIGRFDPSSLFAPFAGVTPDEPPDPRYESGETNFLYSRRTRITPAGDGFLVSGSLSEAPGLGAGSDGGADSVSYAVFRASVDDGQIVGDRDFGEHRGPDQLVGLIYPSHSFDERAWDGRGTTTVDPFGRVLVALRTFEDGTGTIGRWTARGEADLSFGDGGQVRLEPFEDVDAQAPRFDVVDVLPRRDGSVAVVGFVVDDDRPDDLPVPVEAALDASDANVAVIALDPNGRYDAAFADGPLGPGRSVPPIDLDPGLNALRPTGLPEPIRATPWQLVDDQHDSRSTPDDDGGLLLLAKAYREEFHDPDETDPDVVDLLSQLPVLLQLDLGTFGDAGTASDVLTETAPDGSPLRVARVRGTAVDDRLVLRRNGDVVEAFGGADGDVLLGSYPIADLDRIELHGGGGADVIVNEVVDGPPVSLRGGGGDDTLRSAGRFDRLYGHGGDDTLETTGGGEQRLYGGDGNDRLTAAGVVAMYGGAGDDTLAGSGGADLLDGGGGADSLVGGEGDDSIVAGGGSRDGGLGRDLLMAGVGPIDVDLADESGFEDVLGSAGDDVILGDDAANLLIGNGGADSIDGRGGDDTILAGGTLNGGDGDDLLLSAGVAASFAGGPGRDIAFGNGTADDDVEDRPATLAELLELLDRG